MKIKVMMTLIATAMLTMSSFAATNTVAASTSTSTNAVPVVKIGKLVFEGDGSSIEKAVVVKNAKNEMEGVAAESKWVRKVHPTWMKGNQALLSVKGKDYDRIEYRTPDGKTETIFFDITEFFGKF